MSFEDKILFEKEKNKTKKAFLTNYGS